jgi:hypothetical protein
VHELNLRITGFRYGPGWWTSRGDVHQYLPDGGTRHGRSVRIAVPDRDRGPAGTNRKRSGSGGGRFRHVEVSRVVQTDAGHQQLASRLSTLFTGFAGGS